MSSITINFAPLKQQEFTIPLFRRVKFNMEERNEDKTVFSLQLPIDENTLEIKQYYWLSFEKQEGYEPKEYSSLIDVNLTKRYLFYLLVNKCQLILTSDDFKINLEYGDNKIKFVLKIHPEGSEVLWLSPYYLYKNKEYGFLIDYKFDRNPNQVFNRRIQQLSLSLDNENRPNKELCLDKFEKLKEFAKKYYKLLFSKQLIDFESFVQLPSEPLMPREYLFKGNKTASTPSVGLNMYGPYKEVEKPVVFYFYRNEDEKDKAFKLYSTLISSDNRFYKGLQQTYSLSINQDNIRGLDASKYKNTIAIEDLATRLKERHPNQHIIILAFNPFKEEKGESKKRYLRIKYGFAQKNIPVQFAVYNTITNSNSLSSAIPNLALAIFAKLGGYPWRVKPSYENCLVIGVSQTIHRQMNSKDKKYIAYSVLLDTGGIYKSLEVLSAEKDQVKYITTLKTRLASVLNEAQNQYTKVVLHVSFKLKRKELNAIRQVIESFENAIEFVVMRINTENNFWGYDQSQAHLTPTKNQYVELSDSKYLLWLDGLNQSSDNPTKRYSGPIYVDFYYTNAVLDSVRKKQYLQDLLNLSGANWRGMNAKAVPVSIQYCKLVSNYIKDFKEYLNIDTLQQEFINPWFL
ncbi:hypothetical protein GCM10023187_52070 [Nibrella viscosa]|uniref:Protein argonaute n=1 Tax=Nibrella viscosa TaxID=1084524 RepID=A0ABP8KYA0_9BACT